MTPASIINSIPSSAGKSYIILFFIPLPISSFSLGKKREIIQRQEQALGRYFTGRLPSALNAPPPTNGYLQLIRRQKDRASDEAPALSYQRPINIFGVSPVGMDLP